MKRSRAWIRPTALAILLLSLGWWLYLEHVDPRYDGRRASEWLRLLHSESDEEVEAAERAVFILGERAVPQIRKFFYAKVGVASRLMERVEEFAGWEVQTDSDSEDRAAAERAIEILGGNAVAMMPWLIGTLDDEDSGYDSRNAIESIGPSAAPYLKEALRHHDRDGVRSHVVKLLFEQDHRDIVPELKDCLRSEHPPLRAAAIVALARFNPSSAETLNLIRPFLADRNENVRAHAVEVLGYLSTIEPELIGQFLEFYHDPEEAVRDRVVRRLGWACSLDAHAIDLLIKSIGDSSDRLRRSCLFDIVWMLDADNLTSRWAPFESVADSLHPYMSLPFPDVAQNPEAIFARSDQILPKLLKGMILTNAYVQGDRNDSRSLSITAMLLVDPRFRPHVQAILAETKKVVPLKNPTAGTGIDWERTIGMAKMSDEGWFIISEHLNAISQIDSQLAKIVYLRLLNRYERPPAELIEVFKPFEGVRVRMNLNHP